MPRMSKKQKMFFKPTNERLTRIISIKSPRAFKKSLVEIRKNGMTAKEKRALLLARNRATAQLARKNLSAKERRQFNKIAKTKIGNVTSKLKRVK